MRSRALHADDGFRIYSADGHRGWRLGGRRCVDCRIRYRQPAYHPKRNQARGRGRSIPHAIGTGLRLWMMREHVDRRLLFSFGVTSAAGALLGALLHQQVEGPILTAVFGSLLVFAGLAGLSGLAERMRFSGVLAWIAGAVSGFLGGLVGNQGGIRSAAMLGVDVPKEAFVATATAIALIVDVARVPAYLMTQGQDFVNLWFLITASTAGVVIGTLIGAPVLKRVPERVFRPVVSAIVLILGGAMLFSLTQ
jgi:uncharacterized protein